MVINSIQNGQQCFEILNSNSVIGGDHEESRRPRTMNEFNSCMHRAPCPNLRSGVVKKKDRVFFTIRNLVRSTNAQSYCNCTNL
mmetsp:Transcript_5983/g.14834  ORF Transcript_5983/g.14834 Transcript_5983/m.14834 type:complete len:84 (-) Transcript_5983:2106-2357(-)